MSITGAKPSYATGYAHGPFEAKYPELWTGSQGLWAPSLGATGLTLRDVSGHRHHGTFESIDSSVWTSDGERGSVIDLPGGVGDAIDVGHIASIDNVPEVTISAWVKTASDGYHYPRIACNGQNDPIAVRATTGSNYTLRINGTSLTSTGWPGFDVWTHIVARYRSGETNGKQLWFDGELNNSATQSGNTNTTEDSFQIGNAPDTDLPYKGQVGTVGLWNRVLTPSEIQTLYREPLAQLVLKPRVYPVGAGGAPPTIVASPYYYPWSSV